MHIGEPTDKQLTARARRYLHYFLTASVIALSLGAQARADDDTSRLRNINGTIGMIDMPSARMAPDGEIGAGATFFDKNERYNFSFQALPWLETGFLYSGLTHYDPTYPVYYDRSFSLKARLWNEGDWLPTVAIGINDVIGTGVYSGEYMVASKRFGDFDATIGLGFGRLATANTITNPLIYIDRSLKVRGSDNQGQFSSSYFSGQNAGVFGGVIWHTPIEHLSLVAEYSSDAYTLEQSRGNFSPRNQANFELAYEAFDTATIGLGWLYGRAFSGNISFSLDPTTSGFGSRLGPELPPVHIRTEQEQQQAINNILNEQNGSLKAATLAASNRNTLVDALWLNGPALNDVSVNGRVLQIAYTNADQDLKRSCQDAALIVARYDMAIDAVDVHRSSKSQRCRVPVLLHPVAFTDMGATQLAGLAFAPPSLANIDASGSDTRTTKDVVATIQKDAAKQNIAVQAVAVKNTEAVVYYANLKYHYERDAIERLVRILLADTPASVEKFRLIAASNAIAENEFDILRAPTERSISQNGRYSLVDNGNHIVAPPLENPVMMDGERGTYPHFSYSIFPQFRQELFDPSNPFAVQFLVGVEGVVEVRPGLSLTGEVEGNIYDNFNVERASDSVLPHVRTDWTRYFIEGKNGVGELDAQYFFRLSPEVFARLKVGYLESMFAGVGGEMLWRPEYSRWALGADLYEVGQRNFDRLFGLQHYRVMTGHVSLYYASPWYGINFLVRAGQYLAGDRGVTFEITRRFETGVELGVFATKTNVSAAQFGEGSFDKGFLVRIPLDWTLPVNTQAQLNTVLRPVQRDGGQMLDGDATLYDQLRPSGYGDVIDSGDILIH